MVRLRECTSASCTVERCDVTVIGGSCVTEYLFFTQKGSCDRGEGESEQGDLEAVSMAIVEASHRGGECRQVTLGKSGPSLDGELRITISSGERRSYTMPPLCESDLEPTHGRRLRVTE